MHREDKMWLWMRRNVLIVAERKLVSGHTSDVRRAGALGLGESFDSN